MSWADLVAPSLELGPWKALHNPGRLGMEPLGLWTGDLS